MSNSQTSSHNLRFDLIATAVVLLTVGAITLSYNPLANAGRGVLYASAVNEYNRHNYSTTLTLLRYDQPATTKSLNLETKALLEEGSATAAITPAEAAVKLDPTNSTSILLLGATDALAGRPLNDSKSVEGLGKLRTSNTVKAQELYVLGLLRSSQRVLLAVHQPSSQRSILLANLALALTPGKTGAVAATPYAKAAVDLDPSSIAARRLCISVSRQTGDEVMADKQAALLARLEAGRP